jgi:RNA polymerase sigma-70 factor (ECF subfamily)
LYVGQWIVEARGGSRSALERLLEAYSPHLLALAKRELCAALRSRLDPADVVQDTLLKAWRNFPQFRGETESDLLAWLRQILRRNLTNERREHILSAMRSIQREVHLAETGMISRRDDPGSEVGSPDRQAQALEWHEMLEMVLRRLPKNYRQVLHLHTQEEMTFAQVGRQLCCSSEAARKLWKRAAKKLARLLRDVWRA